MWKTEGFNNQLRDKRRWCNRTGAKDYCCRKQTYSKYLTLGKGMDISTSLHAHTSQTEILQIPTPDAYPPSQSPVLNRAEQVRNLGSPWFLHAVCNSLICLAVTKHPAKNIWGWGRVYLAYSSTSQFIILESQGKNMKQNNGGMLFAGSSSRSCLASFLTQPKQPAQKIVVSTFDWALLHQ